MRSLSLALLLLLAACGAKKEDKNFLELVKVDDKAQLDAFVEAMRLDPKTPEGVGSLLSMQKIGHDKSVLFCTWFLIGKNIAMTNAHCVPKDIREGNVKSCSHALQGAIQTKQGPQKRYCKRVLKASELGPSVFTSNDYALLELNAPVEASPLKLSREGVTDNEKVRVLTMNHATETVGEFVQHDCLVRSSDVYGRLVSRGSSPATGFKEEGAPGRCQTVPGNSGSPVLNAAGKVVGVLHAGMAEAGGIAENVKATDNIAVFTNLRCLKLGVSALDKDLPPDCAEEKRDLEELKKALYARIDEKFKAILKEQLAALPTFADYAPLVQHLGNRILVNIEPTCLHDPGKWTEAEKKLVRKHGFIFKTKEVDVRVRQFEVITTVATDYYGNFNFTMNTNFLRTDWYEIKKLEKLKGRALLPLLLHGPDEKVKPKELNIGICGVFR